VPIEIENEKYECAVQLCKCAVQLCVFFRTIRGMDMDEITIPAKEFPRGQCGEVFFSFTRIIHCVLIFGRFLFGHKCDVFMCVCIVGLVKWLVTNVKYVCMYVCMYVGLVKWSGHKFDGCG